MRVAAHRAVSTAGLFGPPTFFQYGIGSAGLGAWRELAAQEMASEWVPSGEHAGFPLLHHWRVLPGSSPTPDEHDDLERTIAYWGGSAGVRRRFEALRRSPAHLVLFLEFLPRTVHHWLLDRVADGERLYFADFGPAISTRFALSPAEAEFFAAHRNHDRCHTVAHLPGRLGRNLDPLPVSTARGSCRRGPRRGR